MRFRTRGFISLLLACCFLVVAVSGVVLYVTPRGRVANWTGWSLCGLGKHDWSAVHINACLSLLVITSIHLFLNWRVFWSYIKKKAAGFNLKVEMAIAVLMTAAVVAGTLMEIPPLSATAAFNERIKAYWEEKAPTGPVPHAEEFTVEHFAQTVGLSVEDIQTALKKEGLVVEDTGTTIAALAEQNAMVPSEVYAVITKHFPEAASALRPGRGRGRGMGRGAGGAGRGQCDAEEQGGHEGPDLGSGPTGTEEKWEGFGLGGGRGRGGRGMGSPWGRGQGRGLGRGESSGNAPKDDVEPGAPDRVDPPGH